MRLGDRDGVADDPLAVGAVGAQRPLAGEEQELADAAAALLDDPALRERCRAAALADVRGYAWPVIARRYYDALYRPVLESTP